jgi:hypothetical protein
LRLSSISAHEVRALATSWATFKGVTLLEIMQAVSGSLIRSSLNSTLETAGL